MKMLEFSCEGLMIGGYAATARYDRPAPGYRWGRLVVTIDSEPGLDAAEALHVLERFSAPIGAVVPVAMEEQPSPTTIGDEDVFVLTPAGRDFSDKAEALGRAAKAAEAEERPSPTPIGDEAEAARGRLRAKRAERAATASSSLREDAVAKPEGKRGAPHPADQELRERAVPVSREDSAMPESGVTLTPELAGARSIADVLRALEAQGITERLAVVEAAKSVADRVPALAALARLERAVLAAIDRRALDLPAVS